MIPPLMCITPSEGNWYKAKNWYMPARKIVFAKYGHYYESHYYGSRAAAASFGLVVGAVKPLLMPVWLIVSALALPIIGLVRRAGHKGDGRQWLKMGLNSGLGAIGVITFLALSAYFQAPPIVTIGALTSVMSVSITYHVYVYLKGPKRGPTPF